MEILLTLRVSYLSPRCPKRQVHRDFATFEGLRNESHQKSQVSPQGHDWREGGYPSIESLIVMMIQLEIMTRENDECRIGSQESQQIPDVSFGIDLW